MLVPPVGFVLFGGEELGLEGGVEHGWVSVPCALCLSHDPWQ